MLFWFTPTVPKAALKNYLLNATQQSDKINDYLVNIPEQLAAKRATRFSQKLVENRNKAKRRVSIRLKSIRWPET